MTTKAPTIQHLNLQEGLAYLGLLVQFRIHRHFESDRGPVDLPEFGMVNDQSFFLEFVKKRELTFEEFIVLMLALAPHLQPSFLKSIIDEAVPGTQNFPEIGGVTSDKDLYFYPTGETALYLLGELSIKDRLQNIQLFDSQHFFSKENILYLEDVKSGQPKTTGKLILNTDWQELLIYGKKSLPKLSISFPARHIKTSRTWDDLVLMDKTLNQIKEIEIWIKHHKHLMDEWNMAGKIKPGYRALFHGPPGTGKTLTASLLGKYTEKEVFQVELSSVVSKYIGETEKNLGSLFDKAETRDWILFFDEADALFGKRTNVSDSHDKYANQEVSYLLQRIEQFPGLVILATNFKGNIDDAFTRRFHSIIEFPYPKPQERLKIWEKAFPKQVEFDKEINLERIAQQYEVTGANIINIVQYCCLQLLEQNSNVLTMPILTSGIRREYLKEDKIW